MEDHNFVEGQVGDVVLALAADSSIRWWNWCGVQSFGGRVECWDALEESL